MVKWDKAIKGLNRTLGILFNEQFSPCTQYQLKSHSLIK